MLSGLAVRPMPPHLALASDFLRTTNAGHYRYGRASPPVGLVITAMGPDGGNTNTCASKLLCGRTFHPYKFTLSITSSYNTSKHITRKHLAQKMVRTNQPGPTFPVPNVRVVELTQWP